MSEVFTRNETNVPSEANPSNQIKVFRWTEIFGAEMQINSKPLHIFFYE